MNTEYERISGLFSKLNDVYGDGDGANKIVNHLKSSAVNATIESVNGVTWDGVDTAALLVKLVGQLHSIGIEVVRSSHDDPAAMPFGSHSKRPDKNTLGVTSTRVDHGTYTTVIWVDSSLTTEQSLTVLCHECGHALSPIRGVARPDTAEMPKELAALLGLGGDGPSTDFCELAAQLGAHLFIEDLGGNPWGMTRIYCAGLIPSVSEFDFVEGAAINAYRGCRLAWLGIA